MKLKYLAIIVAFYCSTSCILSQFNFKFQNIEFETAKVLYNTKDTISYVFSKGSFSESKSNLFWLQGSLPKPLIFEINDTTFHLASIANFKIDSLVSKYNIFIISRPFTPIRKNIKDLNKQYYYVPDKTKPYSCDSNYLNTNYLEYLAPRISFFINYANKKYETLENKTVIIGHSQGMIEASKVGMMNKNVTHNVMLSSNPTGRIQGALLENRIAFIKNEIDFAQYVENKNHFYEYYKYVIDDTNKISRFGDPNKTTRSFSNSIIPDLLQTNAKMFIGVGSLDAGSIMLDLIPLDFIKAKKEVPTIKIYEGLDHNFFQKKEDGTPDYENGKWNDVMLEVYEWLETN